MNYTGPWLPAPLRRCVTVSGFLIGKEAQDVIAAGVGSSSFSSFGSRLLH